MNSTVPAAFLSYSHFDDEHDGQYITQFRELLEREIRAQTGRQDFVIFQDWRDIRWGQQWKERIEQTLDSATFLIPILSPNFFASPECRQEVERFLAREKALARNDLILPIYYIDSPLLSDTVAAQLDSLAQLFNSRQYFDWRPLRLKSLKSQTVRQAVISLAQSIRKAVQTAPTPPSEPGAGPERSQRDQPSYPRTHDLSATGQPSDRDERRRALEAALETACQQEEDLLIAGQDNTIRVRRNYCYSLSPKPSPSPPPPPLSASPPESVLLGASAPANVQPGEEFTLRFIAYLQELESHVDRILKGLSPRSKSHLGLGLCRWNEGLHVTVILSCQYLDIAEPRQEFVWHSPYQVIPFDVVAQRTEPEETVVLKLDVNILGIRVAALRLDLRIGKIRRVRTRAYPNRRKCQKATVIPATTAFASYASQDRCRVLDRVDALQISAGMDIFTDCLSLNPSEPWKKTILEEIRDRNIFLLFWSKDARLSRWVKWEWTTALEKRGEEVIQLQPLDTVEDAPPPPELAHLHFGSPVMRIRKSYEATTTQNIYGWSAQRLQALQRQAAQALKVPVEFRDTLKDGSQGPVMMVIPGGRFLMGSPKNEPGRGDDECQHEVEVSVFAIGKYEVTFEEYDRFAEATGREKPSDEGWGRGRRPVINVSRFDASAYTDWISQQTGQSYRLPTEAEWEYACRAGSTTRYCFGDDEQRLREYGWYSSNAERKTHPVGEKLPNAWQLYDMHGNVWEWVQDWYGDYSKEPQQRDPSGPESGANRVCRGGSWNYDADGYRSAFRYRWHVPAYRDNNLGFRLARRV